VNCEIKDTLSQACERSTREFADAVTFLNQQRSQTDTAEHNSFRVAAGMARFNSENARLTLDRHIVEQGCYSKILHQNRLWVVLYSSITMHESW